MSEQLIATAACKFQTEQDLETLSESLNSQLQSAPDLIIASYSSLCDTGLVVNGLAALYPNSAIAGAFTCRGAITAD